MVFTHLVGLIVSLPWQCWREKHQHWPYLGFKMPYGKVETLGLCLIEGNLLPPGQKNGIWDLALALVEAWPSELPSRLDPYTLLCPPFRMNLTGPTDALARKRSFRKFHSPEDMSVCGRDGHPLNEIMFPYSSKVLPPMLAGLRCSTCWLFRSQYYSSEGITFPPVSLCPTPKA